MMMMMLVTLATSLAVISSSGSAPIYSKPLSVLSITPSTGSARVAQTESAGAAAATRLSGREAITITFSNAVIPLGADFGPGELPNALTPFTISPNVKGSVRWVTTSIARFDPDTEWPPELELTLALNPALRSFDGRTVTLGAGVITSWRFTTPALYLYATRVRSAAALALTNNTWSASLHPLAPGARELPPDGTIMLRFSSPVQLDVLRGAFRLRLLPPPPDGPSSSSAASSAPSVTAPLPGVLLSPCRPPSPRCVVAALDATLAVGALYDLILPIGSRFHDAAGSTHAEKSVRLSGLVPFRIPFVESPPTSEANGFRPRYRRLRVWLRHGLSPGTTAEHLARHLDLSAAPATSPWSQLLGGGAGPRRNLEIGISLISAGLAELSVPELEPETRYTLTVTPSSLADGASPPASLRDGFGLPLLASSLTFTTAGLESLFVEPTANGRSSQGGLRFSAHNATAASTVLRQWP